MARSNEAELPNWLKIEAEQVLLSTAKTAEFFAVTRETLSSWAKKGAPKEARGWWSPKTLMEWLGKSQGQQANEMSMEARKLKADAEYREEKAKREKRMNEILEGQYLPADEIENEWARRITEVKTGLLALRNTIVAQFSDPDIRLVVERVLTNEIHELLEQYARDGAYTPKQARKKARKG